MEETYKETYEYKEAMRLRLCGVAVKEEEVDSNDVTNNPKSMAEMYLAGKRKYKQARDFGFNHLQALLVAKKLR